MACGIHGNMADVGGQLRAAREKRGLALAEVATAAGTDKANLSRIERGLRDPRVGMVERVVVAMRARMELKIK